MMGALRNSPPIPANTRQAYPANVAGGTSVAARGHGFGARGHQVFGTVLEPFVQRGDGRDGVDLVRRLVGSQPDDPGEPQREAGGVPLRASDDVECDLDDDSRLDLPISPKARDRVGLEPAGHLRDLRVGQSAVGLADVDEPVGRRVPDRERVVAQDPVPLAVADLDPDHHAIDRRQRLLHLQPAEASASRHVDARRILDHQPLVPPGP
jgi:hypothetical protein